MTIARTIGIIGVYGAVVGGWVHGNKVVGNNKRKIKQTKLVLENLFKK